MIHSLPEGVLIALFAWAVLRVLPKQNSRTRFAVWFVALIAVVGLACVGGSLSEIPHPNAANGGTLGWGTDGFSVRGLSSLGLSSLSFISFRVSQIHLPADWAGYSVARMGCDCFSCDDSFGGGTLEFAGVAAELHSGECG